MRPAPSMPSRSLPIRPAIVALAACMAFGVTVCADDPDPVLTGPKVADRDVPGVTNSFGEGGQNRRYANRVPPQVLNEALEGLLADDAPADIRATPEQAERIRAIRADYQRKQREFQREHRAELQQLRRRAGDFQRPREGASDRAPAPRAPAGETDMMQEGMQDGMQESPQNRERTDAAAARERARVLMEKAPKAEDVQVLVWEILTQPQKDHVEAEVQEYRDQEEMRRAERYVQERLKNRDAAPPPPAPGQPQRARPGAAQAPGRPAPSDRQIAPERRERLMKFFASLSPEQQDQLLDRLEARMRDEAPEQNNRARRAPRDGGAEKPAPKTEDIKVPSDKEMGTNG